MIIALLVSSIVLWLAMLFVAFVVLGSLRRTDELHRQLDILRWQLDELKAITPVRLGRGGLKPGKKAPEFKLPSVVGPEVALSDYLDRKVFLVFVQTGCSPCHAVVPELNELHKQGKIQVLAINNAASSDAARQWASEAGAVFPVLMQENWKVSKQYQVMATPFAFVINEKGVIASKGIANSKEQIGFVLDGKRDKAEAEHDEAESTNVDTHESNGSLSLSHEKELEHV
ncbi:MAG TPA: TlpA disulfide reductase family protein [Gemmataceae bacterium]|jgi:methylamine dehydrogenase accessory protein MauD|nr:TlpA disulfide reductase family protein [Gemmataceae bacterium]